MDLTLASRCFKRGRQLSRWQSVRWMQQVLGSKKQGHMKIRLQHLNQCEVSSSLCHLD